MALEKDQKTFIKAKVKELGSMKKVKVLYNQDCAIDRFAITYAKKILKK